MVPRIVGELQWPGPLCVDELRFLKAHTRRPVKATVIGPLTSLDRMVDEYYGDEERSVMAMAAALNQELRALDAEGLDLLQIDEPVFHFRLSRARRYGVQAINRMVEGISTPVAVHVCYGYATFVDHKDANPAYAECLRLLSECDIDAISLEYEQPGHEPDVLANCGDKHVILGLLNLGTHEVETAGHIERRIQDALEVIPARRLHPSSDCGLWFLPREVAFGKIQSLGMATAATRTRLGL
jgi:5-methyltetrahydropteroyltriglutamate--homocysteine methyltransferase